MKVTYITHSCFLIETDTLALLFDYYGEQELPKIDKKLIVLASHSHYDHYNEVIFNLNAAHFIISDDIKTDAKDNLIFVKPGDKINCEGLDFAIHGSTDLGVSFSFKLEGKAIYFAADNNIWLWDKEWEYMKDAFTKNIEGLKEIDIAFLPVDPRLEGNAYLTAFKIYEDYKVKDIIPLHLWNDYTMGTKLIEQFKDNNIEVEVFDYKDHYESKEF